MSRPTGDELASLREDGLSAERRGAFRASERAAAAWGRTQAGDLEGVLAWIEQLRALFGDPPVDREPWRGEDFQL